MSTRRVRALSVVALGAGVVLLASACGGGSSNNANSGPSGDVKAWATAKGESNGSYTAPVVAQTNNVIKLITDKPWNAYNNGLAATSNTYNGFINILTLESPYLLDGNDKVLLNHDLMSSVTETSQSPQTVVYNINPKAVWSDGAPVSCDDFYLQWLANNGALAAFTTAGTTGYSQMNAPTCSNNGKTVTTTYSTPFSDWKSLFDVSSNNLMPAHILEQNTGIADIKTVTLTSPATLVSKAATFWDNGWIGFNAKNDVSDGPYVITAYQQNQSITLSRNPKWYGNAGGPAGFFIKFAADLVTQSQALQNGDVQVQYSAQPDANGSQALQSLSSQGVSYQAEAGLSFEHLDLNYRNPLFQDQAVRKAFFQCVNRNDIVNKLIKPIESDAQPANSVLFFPGEQGLADNYSAEATGSAAQAKATLEADGWTVPANGPATKDGKTLAFTISHTDIPRRTQTVQLVQSDCKAAGFAITDKTDPNFLNGPVSQGDYDVALFAWSLTPFKSGSVAAYQTGGGENWSNYSDKTVDSDFTKALDQTSTEAAMPYYQAADKQLASDYYTLPLFYTPNQWAISSGITGPYYQGYNGLLWDANEWTQSGS